MNKTTKTTTHAEENAEGHAETILELYRAAQEVQNGAEVVTFEGDDYTNEDSLRDRATDGALSVEVRGPWYTPGSGEGIHASEFQILISTGGPALRIIGDLTEYGEPDADNARMEVQDWGTPWTEYRPGAAGDADDWGAAWAWFLGCFGCFEG